MTEQMMTIVEEINAHTDRGYNLSERLADFFLELARLEGRVTSEEDERRLIDKGDREAVVYWLDFTAAERREIATKLGLK